MIKTEKLTKLFATEEVQTKALNEVTLQVEQGEFVAIMGPSGCGKSTLVNLIPRFFDVTEGSITLDGRDIRNITLESLRENIGYVPQKGVLFSGNIASNIMFGNQDGTEEEMKEAAEIAQATEFIETKPEGYESPIAQGGSNVSGGQKQRVLLARALCATKKLLLLDEPVTGLDPIVTAEFYQLIQKINRESGIAVVMVSHDIESAVEYPSHILHLQETVLYFGKASQYKKSRAGKAFLGGEQQ